MEYFVIDFAHLIFPPTDEEVRYSNVFRWNIFKAIFSFHFNKLSTNFFFSIFTTFAINKHFTFGRWFPFMINRVYIHQISRLSHFLFNCASSSACRLVCPSVIGVAVTVDVAVDVAVAVSPHFFETRLNLTITDANVERSNKWNKRINISNPLGLGADYHNFRSRLRRVKLDSAQMFQFGLHTCD